MPVQVAGSVIEASTVPTVVPASASVRTDVPLLELPPESNSYNLLEPSLDEGFYYAKRASPTFYLRSENEPNLRKLWIGKVSLSSFIV